MNEKSIKKNVALLNHVDADKERVESDYLNALSRFDYKVVVLDDDPTGVQTVNGIYVITDWEVENLVDRFLAPERMFYILTNSRSLGSLETQSLHRTIVSNIVEAAQKVGKKFIIVSRSDSTLRGHYPIETETIRQTLSKLEHTEIDGEIIIPFFPEGERYTINDIHYVGSGEVLIPAGNTEFAKDKVFGFHSSNLQEWIEEKTKGKYAANDVISISLDDLRAFNYSAIENKLKKLHGFNKMIVNATEYTDIKIFAVALINMINEGYTFILRTAAALPKVLGGIRDIPLLDHKTLTKENNANGGLIIVGSHVNRTTKQVDYLKKKKSIRFVEFNQHLVIDSAAFELERNRVQEEVNQCISNGKTVVVFTRRERFDINTGHPEDELVISERISAALTSIVTNLCAQPKFIIAKGGITSSDIGVKGLKVKKALVIGQILPGVPVWLTDDESLFPNMPYIVFPGNVGSESALLEAVNKCTNLA